jgi:hypothetical protein
VFVRAVTRGGSERDRVGVDVGSGFVCRLVSQSVGQSVSRSVWEGRGWLLSTTARAKPWFPGGVARSGARGVRGISFGAHPTVVGEVEAS